ncbi:hypothetical protein QUF82_18470 [Thiotrichales bacterium HSG14]|nr:hypothetical protein [Thiotrichales bacterium HSG14]
MAIYLIEFQNITWQIPYHCMIISDVNKKTPRPLNVVFSILNVKGEHYTNNSREYKILIRKKYKIPHFTHFLNVVFSTLTIKEEHYTKNRREYKT